jgi:myosin heavy subunit
LHLGNIKFETGFGEGSAINDKADLEKASQILQINTERLELGLCKPRIKAGNEYVQVGFHKSFHPNFFDRSI